MKIEQIYTGCLAQGAYYISSENEAVVIDPLREIQPYLDRAEKNGDKILYVFETHFHADFVSGHVDLANESGATIVFGPTASPTFQSYIAKDNEEFKIGKIIIRAIHTPGHTPESTCYLLIDEDGKMKALFTGDTLFIGDVGRPDLAQKSDITQEDLAGMLYDSLRNKVMTLPDDIIIYPAHGAGSACGKNMSRETFDTLGNQKEINYALRKGLSRNEFIKEVTDGLLPPPGYFPLNVLMNKEGYKNIREVIRSGKSALSPDDFELQMEDALVLDVRSAEDFSKGFIPGSVNIGIDGQFAPWAGALITDVQQKILLVTPEGREEETVTRLARVGFDNTAGYLEGGFEKWKASGKDVDTIENITGDELASIFGKAGTLVVDVRKPNEYSTNHIEGVPNIPLDFINERMTDIPRDKKLFIHCAGGYRSMIFSSILKARGYSDIVNVKHGFSKLKENGKFPVVAEMPA